MRATQIFLFVITLALMVFGAFLITNNLGTEGTMTRAMLGFGVLALSTPLSVFVCMEQNERKTINLYFLTLTFTKTI
jgi:hypothetical protein